MNRDEKLNLTELKERGWTKTMVSKLLMEHDDCVSNPYGGADIKYWSKVRVEQAENTQEFKKMLESATKRSANAKEAAGKRREALLSNIRAMEIRIIKLPALQILNNAISSYNAFQSGRRSGDLLSASVFSEKVFLERIQVNYIRHELTNYDYELEDVAGKVGVLEAKDIIRDKILGAIADNYPHLQEAVDSQRERYAEREIYRM